MKTRNRTNDRLNHRKNKLINNHTKLGLIENSKKLGILLLTIALMLSTLSVATFASEYDVKLAINNITSEDDLVAGTQVKVDIELKNTGYYIIQEGTFILESQTEGIRISDVISSQQIHEIWSNYTETISYGLTLDVDLPAGNYPLLLTGSYKGQYDQVSTFEEVIYLKIEGQDANDFMKITQNSSQMTTGESNSLSLSVANNYPYEIRDINISLHKDYEGMTLLSNYIVKDLDMNPKSSSDLNSMLYISENLESGYYPIEILISYTRDMKTVHEIETIYLSVLNKADQLEKQEIGITEVLVSDTSIRPNVTTTITVTVENLSDEVINDAIVQISQDPSLILVSQSKYVIDTLGVGGSISETFILKATDTAVTGNVPVEVQVIYNDGLKNELYYTGVYISNDEEDELVTTPRIIIESYSTNKAPLFVGDEFDFEVSIENTSNEKSIKNMKLTITMMDEIGETTDILPINQSQSVFVGDMNREEIKTISIPFEILASATGQIYTMDFVFEYEDQDGVAYTDHDTINLPVYQASEITLSDVRVGKLLDNGYTLEMDFYNTGKVTIDNLMIDINGDFETLNSNYFVGDFIAGRMDVYDVQIQGDAPEIIKGTIIYTYDDTFGEKVTKEKVFEIKNVLYNEDAIDGTMSSDATTNINENKGGFPIVPIILVLGIITVIIVIVIRKRAKSNESN